MGRALRGGARNKSDLEDDGSDSETKEAGHGIDGGGNGHG